MRESPDTLEALLADLPSHPIGDEPELPFPPGIEQEWREEDEMREESQ